MIKLKKLINESFKPKFRDTEKLAKTIGRKIDDVAKFLKKYEIHADDLLDVLDAGSSSQRRRYSMAILAAMKGNRRALKDLDNLLGFLTEQQFKAKSKETGRVVVYKSKDSMDKAIKGGTAEPLDKKTTDKPEKVKGADLFKKDKPKLDPKQKQRAQDDYNDAIRNIKNPLMAGGIEPYYVDMAADNLKKLGNPDAKVFKDLGKEFRDNLDDDGNPKDEKLDKQIQDKIKQAALDLETDITKDLSKPEKNEGIIKLKSLLKEGKVWERKFGESLPTLEDTTKAYKLKLEQQFKAKSKETGRVVVYKSKDAMDKAIKGGTAEPLDKKTSGKPEKVKGADLFKKDVQKKVQKKKTDTNVKVYDSGKEVSLSPKEQRLLNKSKKALDGIGDYRKTTSKLDGTEQEVIYQIDRIKRGEYRSANVLPGPDSDIGGGMVKLSKKEQKDALDAWTKAVQKMYDDGVFGDDISREDIKPENSDKIKKLISKSQKNIKKQIEDAGFSEFRGNFFDKRDKKVKEVPKVSTAKVSKQAVKKVSDLSNEIEKNIDDAYGDLDSDKRDNFATTLQNVGTFLEDEIDYDALSQEDRKEFDQIFGDIEDQVMHLQNDESGMGSIEGDPREVSKRAVKFINKFSTKNEGIIKLKSLLSEEVLNENMVSVLKPPLRKAKSTIYGYINLQYHAVPLIKSMREFLKLISKIDIVGIDFDDREDIKPIWDLGHWRPPFIREPVSVSIKKLEKALKNPKNFKEPERIDYSVPKRLGSVLFPKYRQVVNAYKQFDKFNNKKVSDVFRDTKGKRIGNRLIGDFGGFILLQDVSKLLNNEGGFQLRDSLPDILRDIEYKADKKRGKKIVQGANE